MDHKEIREAIERYFNGESTTEEERQLRVLFSQERIPEDLQPLVSYFREIENKINETTDVDPFAKIDFETFEEKGKEEFPEDRNRIYGLTTGQLHWVLRIAAGIILVLTGFSGGLLVNSEMTPATQTDELLVLRNDIQELRNTLVFGSYRQVSASDRISAVNRTVSMQSGVLDEELTAILIHTINNDKSVNVRLTAAAALFRFRDDPLIGRAFTNALSNQSDPLMQITLIGYLVDMNERSSVVEMQKLMLADETHELVLERLEAGLAELAS